MFFVKTIREMPIPLAVLTLAGLSAPLLAIFSVSAGVLSKDAPVNLVYGSAANLNELLFIAVLSLPVCLASWLILKRNVLSIYYFIAGWMIVCISPICLSSVRADMDTFLMEALYYAVLGIGIAIYLLKSKVVRHYFYNNIGAR
jgi:hypothetical protein